MSLQTSSPGRRRRRPSQPVRLALSYRDAEYLVHMLEAGKLKTRQVAVLLTVTAVGRIGWKGVPVATVSKWAGVKTLGKHLQMVDQLNIKLDIEQRRGPVIADIHGVSAPEEGAYISVLLPVPVGNKLVQAGYLRLFMYLRSPTCPPHFRKRSVLENIDDDVIDRIAAHLEKIVRDNPDDHFGMRRYAEAALKVLEELNPDRHLLV